MSSDKLPLLRLSPLFLVIIIDTMGFALVIPILAPLFTVVHNGILPVGSSLQLREFYYGLTLSIFFIAAFFGSPFVGDLSDRLGRRKVLLVCLILCGFSYLISAVGLLAHNLWLLILGRGIAGFAAGSQPIAQAAIIDVSTDKNKSFNLSLITLASCIGFVFGPLMSGYFAHKFLTGFAGFATPFFMAALLSFINAISLYFSFKETYVPSTERKKTHLLKGLLSLKMAFTLKPLRKISIACLFQQTAWAIYFQFVSLFLIVTYHYSTQKLGVFMALIGIIFAFSLTFLVRLVVNRYKLELITISSFLCFGASLLLLAIFQHEWMQWLGAFPITIAESISYVSLLTLYSNRVDKDAQGLVMGISASVGSFAWFSGGLMMGLFNAAKPAIPFILASAFLAIAVIILTLDYRDQKPK